MNSEKDFKEISVSFVVENDGTISMDAFKYDNNDNIIEELHEHNVTNPITKCETYDDIFAICENIFN